MITKYQNVEFIVKVLQSLKCLTKSKVSHQFLSDIYYLCSLPRYIEDKLRTTFTYFQFFQYHMTIQSVHLEKLSLTSSIQVKLS